MRFQCLEVTCGKPFGWTAKKTVQDPENPTITYEYVVCPYCGSLDFEEYTAKTGPIKHIPLVQYPKQVSQFDPASLMNHQWKGKKTAPHV